MPAYSFKERFVPLVIEGSKEQTVRARRKHPPRVGQIAYLFYGMRTKACRKLREAPITDVCSIVINHGIFLFNGTLTDIELEVARANPMDPLLPQRILLTAYDRNQFAWNDGFRPEGSSAENPAGCYDLMIRFWSQTHSLPFAGDVIYWNELKKFHFE